MPRWQARLRSRHRRAQSPYRERAIQIFGQAFAEHGSALPVKLCGLSRETGAAFAGKAYAERGSALPVKLCGLSRETGAAFAGKASTERGSALLVKLCGSAAKRGAVFAGKALAEHGSALQDLQKKPASGAGGSGWPASTRGGEIRVDVAQPKTLKRASSSM